MKQDEQMIVVVRNALCVTLVFDNSVMEVFQDREGMVYTRTEVSPDAEKLYPKLPHVRVDDDKQSQVETQTFLETPEVVLEYSGDFAEVNEEHERLLQEDDDEEETQLEYTLIDD